MTGSPSLERGSRRAVQRELADASEDKLAQVVAIVDRLADRGEADDLIAPLRPRLARLRPPRPMRPERLLFAPLDPVLANAADWRRGALGVPRTALGPLAALVRAASTEHELAAVQAALGPSPDPEAMLEPGRLLWPRAAAILAGATPPQGWRHGTGLSELDFLAIARTAGLLLQQAPWFMAAASRAPEHPDAHARVAADLAALLRRVPEADDAAACLFVAVSDRLGGPEARLDAIEAAAPTAVRPALRRARARATRFLLDRLQAAAHLAGDLAQVAHRLGRDARLLDAAPPGVDAEAVRRDLDRRCRARFEAALAGDLAVPAEPDEAAVLALERAARALRLFALAARRLGSADLYDRGLERAAERLRDAPAPGLSTIDRLRLSELLLGAAAVDPLRPRG